MKILFLSRWFPYPADNGAKLRIASMIRHLSMTHEVSLASFVSQEPTDAQLRDARAICAAAQTAPYIVRPAGSRVDAARALLARLPRSMVESHSARMHEIVMREAGRFKPDVVVASAMDMLPYANAAPVARKFLEEVELGVFHDALSRPQSRVARAQAMLRWHKLTRYLRDSLRHYVACSTVSEHERDLVEKHVRPRCPVLVVPNGVDVEACSHVVADPQPDTLIYSGALSYFANFDAVAYFIGEILPRIQAHRPNVRFRVTGSTKSVALDRLPQNSAVEFTGYLDDVRAAVASSWVSVVPLRLGGGTRLKVLESMALGTPVVATGKGVEGIVLAPNADAFVADTPDEFARRVLELLESAELRHEMAARSRRSVSDRYDWAAIWRSFDTALESLVGAPSPAL